MKKEILSISLIAIAIVIMPSFVFASNCKANNALPDFACSTGAVLTTDIKTICATGYTKTVRDVSLSVRKQVFKEYGIPYASSSDYEVDHIISLELGGSNDIKNLFPESYGIANGAKVKDKLENYLHKQVCNGSMNIKEAQKEISTNWVKYYNLYYQDNTSSNNAKDIVSTIAITEPQVKKSSTGICHDKSDRYYTKTTNFKPFNSIKACLESGGRLSK